MHQQSYSYKISPFYIMVTNILLKQNRVHINGILVHLRTFAHVLVSTLRASLTCCELALRSSGRIFIFMSINSNVKRNCNNILGNEGYTKVKYHLELWEGRPKDKF